MFKRGFVALLMVVMLFTVSPLLAQDLDSETDHGYRIVRMEEDSAPFGIFMDGRINATDIAAPIVVFYNEQTVRVLNPDGTQFWAHDVEVWEDQLVSIEVLSVRPGGVELAVSATVDQINTAIQAAVPGENQVIASNGPVSLNYSPTGWFWVEGLYADGKPYSFQWQAQGF